MRAPTVSATVAAPGGVLSDNGLTAVAVPTCCAAAGQHALRQHGAVMAQNGV